MEIGFLHIFTIKSIKSNSRLLVYDYTSSKGKLELYLMIWYVIIGFIVWARKFVGFGDKTNNIRTKQNKKK